MQALWIIVASAMFALMTYCVKLSTAHVGLPLIVFMRGLPSAVLIFAWALYKHKPLIPNEKLAHIKRNVSGVTSMYLGYYATSMLPLAMSTTLNYTTPIFMAIWFVIWKKGYQDLYRISTIIIGFIGVMTILRPSLSNDQISASLVGLMSGGLAAVAYLQIGELGKKGEPGWRIVMYFSVCVTVVGIISMLINPWTPPPSNSILPLLGVGMFGLFGQLSLTQAFTKGSAILSASLQYSTILFAVAIDYLAWHNLPDTLAWLGMFLIVLAGLVSAWRTAAKKSS